MLTWDVAELEPQQKARFSEHGLDPNAPDSEDGDEKELRYKGLISFHSNVAFAAVLSSTAVCMLRQLPDLR